MGLKDVAGISSASLTRGMSEYNPCLSSVSINVRRSVDSPCLAEKDRDRQPARVFHPIPLISLAKIPCLQKAI